MTNHSPIDDDNASNDRGRSLPILIGITLLAAFGAYLGGYLPQFDVLFSQAHTGLAEHNDQIFNVVANGAPFLAAGIALLFLVKMVRRVAAQYQA